MLHHGKDLVLPLRESADVCVIGSGCGGGPAAKILAEAGRKVIVLEAGGSYAPEEFQQTEEWAFTHLYEQRAGLATEDLGVTVLQGRCVGGSSTVNWMTSLRTPEFVLDAWRSTRGVVGFSAMEMEAYFSRIERYLNIHPEPPERHNRQNNIILDGAKKLGWRSRVNGRNASDCLQLGVCGFGCPIGAKRSVDVTYLPDALKAGASIFADCRAERIETAGTVKRVRGSVLDRETRKPRGEFVIEAPVVIVAGSATQSPLLLERSGLGGDHVGLHLTFHLTSAVAGVYEAPQNAWKGIPQSALCDEFLNKDGDGGGFWIEAVPIGPALAGLALPSFGPTHRTLMKKFANIAVSIVLIKEVDSEGRVRSNDAGRPVITYDRGARDRRTMRRAVAAGARLHFAAGAQKVFSLHTQLTEFANEGEIEPKLERASWSTNDLALYSAHPLGTCRMGEDPRASVVNSRGKVHGTEGVFVVDGSVLPTSLGVNPQVTILAVAERNAEWIAENTKVASH